MNAQDLTSVKANIKLESQDENLDRQKGIMELLNEKAKRGDYSPIQDRVDKMIENGAS